MCVCVRVCVCVTACAYHVVTETFRTLPLSCFRAVFHEHVAEALIQLMTTYQLTMGGSIVPLILAARHGLSPVGQVKDAITTMLSGYEIGTSSVLSSVLSPTPPRTCT